MDLYLARSHRAWGDTARVVAAQMLALNAAALMQQGLPEAAAFDWVEVYAFSPEGRTADVLVALAVRDDGTPTPLRDWSDRIGALAPRAWAAGLTLLEADAHAAAGTLTADRLRMLTGLRGWHLLIGHG